MNWGYLIIKKRIYNVNKFVSLDTTLDLGFSRKDIILVWCYTIDFNVTKN